jgi:hypothetical protein
LFTWYFRENVGMAGGVDRYALKKQKAEGRTIIAKQIYVLVHSWYGMVLGSDDSHNTNTNTAISKSLFLKSFDLGSGCFGTCMHERICKRNPDARLKTSATHDTRLT